MTAPRGQIDVIIRTPWGGPWRTFRTPEKVVVATHGDEVVAALEAVDRQVDSGLYAAGFVSYEAAGGLGLPVRASSHGMPLVWFGLYPATRVASVQSLPAAGPYRCSEWTPSISRDAYLERVHAVKGHIEAGDTYQINLTFRMRAEVDGDPLGLFADLVSTQRGDWAAFVLTPTHAICSASPELLVLRDGEHLTCRPMKGTARRGRSSVEDLAMRDALRESEKNRAENVMIVDMARNDLGRLAIVGSVTVPSLFDVEPYPAHWQMTSTVEARAHAAGVSTLVRHLFPSGSVTGAPKHRSMALIQDLEADARGIYTGAVGFMGPDGRGHFSVAIRTVSVDLVSREAIFGVGSGIVWDSVPEEEYDECLVKAAVLAPPSPRFELLETMRWDPVDGYRVRQEHVDRLAASARYFGFAYDPVDVASRLDALADTLIETTRVRLLLARDGSLVLQATPFTRRPSPLRLAVTPAPVDSQDVWLFHKTTRREVYERASATRPDADGVVLWNERGEVTECHDANLVVEIDGRRVTPPAASGLLAGTFRRYLLDRGEIEEAIITLHDLRCANRFWAINSVQEWMDAVLID